MNLSLPASKLTAYVAEQMSRTFPDAHIDSSELDGFIPNALERVEHCFSRIRNKYFARDGEVFFNHLHSDQYAMFLYYLSNTIWRLEGETSLAEKAYCLNKAMHGVDAFYEVELPDVFLLVHPIGTVLGRATYSDHFVAYQGCTVGSKGDARPTIEEGVVMYGRSMLLGACHIGRNCFVAPGAILLNADIANNQIVFGCFPEVGCKPAANSVSQTYFRPDAGAE